MHEDELVPTHDARQPAHRVATWSLMLTLPIVTGIVIGVVRGRTGGGIGFDQLSDFMGGFGIGAVCGLISAVLLPRYVGRRGVHITASIAGILLAVLVVYVVVRTQIG